MTEEVVLNDEQKKAIEFVDRFKNKFEVGSTVLAKLFVLNKDETKAMIKSICGDKLPTYFLDNCHVIKTSEDDKPDSIELVAYDHLIINWIGIEFRPQHGKSRQLVEFNEHFKL
jgi:hypothetical protein